DDLVTGVQTCALPISVGRGRPLPVLRVGAEIDTTQDRLLLEQATLAARDVNVVRRTRRDQRRVAEPVPRVVPLVVAAGGDGVDEIGRASCRGRGWSWV